ncbi:protein phosphatase 2C domain-containing protein [Streptomyces fulvoviolaceus]|uniref:protein phosphatase 2C domain-containing protein n=1 Tax=Streptomyces fulvoviolaceus TaxID=285535 RepID=UPI000AE07AFA|nr:protein phosphatase 2C domain-containing protein [Streptomyces fulvoviolaceus]
MPSHATYQLIGDRSHQCDATATWTHNGARAYVLCDGIGSSDAVHAWTNTAARRLARTAARRTDAEAGLRAVYSNYAAEPERQDEYARYDLPAACAVVAVTAPGKPLTVAWCGDARAYVLTPRGTLHRLTDDHNRRRVSQGSRNLITSCLGATETDEERKAQFGHPAIESMSRVMENCRLLLASDGAYEPLEDSARNLADYLTGSPRHAARDVAAFAVAHAAPHIDNATALVADLRTAPPRVRRSPHPSTRRRSGQHSRTGPPPHPERRHAMPGKLSKEQAQKHNRACELVAAEQELTEEEREFVLDHYHESAHTGRALDGAFFTPAELAGQLHLVVPGQPDHRPVRGHRAPGLARPRLLGPTLGAPAAARDRVRGEEPGVRAGRAAHPAGGDVDLRRRAGRPGHGSWPLRLRDQQPAVRADQAQRQRPRIPGTAVRVPRDRGRRDARPSGRVPHPERLRPVPHRDRIR